MFLKGLLREGSLQDKTGPSIATGFGFVLPDISATAPTGTGGSLGVIVSQRWPAFTAHLNATGALTRQQQADIAFSFILEGRMTGQSGRSPSVLRARLRWDRNRLGTGRCHLARARMREVARLSGGTEAISSWISEAQRGDAN